MVISKLGQGGFLAARRIETGSGFERAGGTPLPISKASTPPPPPRLFSLQELVVFFCFVLSFTDRRSAWSLFIPSTLYPYMTMRTRRSCDVQSTSMTLIERRNNVVYPVGIHCIMPIYRLKSAMFSHVCSYICGIRFMKLLTVSQFFRVRLTCVNLTRKILDTVNCITWNYNVLCFYTTQRPYYYNIGLSI